MRFTLIDAEQRSPEWFAARAGRLTGSRADAILAKGKGGGESITRRDYRLQLACERITGTSQESTFNSADMLRGVVMEPWALAAYEALTGDMVRKTGFLQHIEHAAGCSLDGDINDFSGILELKCPKTATHLGYWRNPQSFINQYFAQIQHNLWVTGAAWCDLVSFDDRLSPKLRLFRRRIERYDAELNTYEANALQFLAEVTNEVNAIRALEEAA